MEGRKRKKGDAMVLLCYSRVVRVTLIVLAIPDRAVIPI